MEEYHFQDVEDVGIAWDVDTRRVWVCINGQSVFRAKVFADGLMLAEYTEPHASPAHPKP